MEIIGLALCGYSIISKKKLNPESIKFIKSNGFNKIIGISLNKKRFLFKDNLSTNDELSNDGSLSIYYNDYYYNNNYSHEVYNKFYYKENNFENCIFLDKYNYEYNINDQLSFSNFKDLHNFELNTDLPLSIKHFKSDKLYYIKTYRGYIISEKYYKLLNYKNNYSIAYGIMGLTIFGFSFIL